MPSNIDPSTAVDLGALPNTITQQVDSGGTTYKVWYKFTAPATGVYGFWAFGDLAVYTPTVEVFESDGVTDYLGGFFAANVPMQMPLVSGQLIYLRIYPNGGNPSPAVLTLSGLAAPTDAIPSGSLLINDDTIGFPLAVLSSLSGTVLQLRTPFPAGESGAILDDGTTIWGDNAVANQFKIYSPALVLVATFVPPSFASNSSNPCSSDGTSTFYVATSGLGLDHAKVQAVSPTGVLGATVYDLGTAGLVGMAPKRDNTVLYYTAGAEIKQWDLVNNVALADLVVALTGYTAHDVLVLNDGTLLVEYHKKSPNSTLVKHYSAAGATLNTYDFGTQNGAFASVPRIAVGADDPTSFWIFLHTNSGLNLFQQVKVSDGTILTSLSQTAYEGGVYQTPATATPVRFGASESCPLLIARAPITPPIPVVGPAGCPVGLPLLPTPVRPACAGTVPPA